MQTYFNIRYEFDKELVGTRIAQQVTKKEADYICVADGVILNVANRNSNYLKIVNGGMFSICDSSYVPLYIRWIYGKRYEQYCGSQIFMDIIRSKKYRMIFIGNIASHAERFAKQSIERKYRCEEYDIPGTSI